MPAAGSVITEKVELLVTAPARKNQLSGLELADRKLASIEHRIDRINALLSKPVELRFNLKSAGQAEKFLREFIERRNPSTSGSRVTGDVRNVKSVADALGVSMRQLNTLIAANVDKIQKGAKTLFEVGSRNTRFSSGDVAARAALVASKELDKERRAGLQSLLSSVGTAGALPVTVGKGAGTGGSGGGGGDSTKVNPNRPFAPPRGTVTQTQTTIPPDPAGVKKIKQSFVDAAGKTADYYFKQSAEGELEGGKTVVRENQAKLKKERERQEKAEQKDKEKLARQMADAREKAAKATYKSQLAYGRDVGIYGDAGVAARLEAQQFAAQAIEERAQQRGLASRKKYAADREKFDKDAEKKRTQAEFEAREKSIRAARNLRAKALGESELARGATRTRSRTTDTALGTSITDVFTRTEGNRLTETTISFGKAGAAISQTTRELKAVRAEAGAAGRGFLQNTAQVTAWAASVGALYGSLALLRSGVVSLVRNEATIARLGQVFRGVGGSAQQLAQDVIKLAAANGRSADEALKAAVQWSRFGLSRAEVNEAVRVSLVAANVAELNAAEATEKLSGIMVAYRLEVGQLDGVLGQLNQTSNTFNVSVGNQLDGVSRTAGVARQAGLSLSQLIGLVGATAGATGQTGANIGNAIKSLTVGLGNPKLAESLRQQFRLEVSTDSAGEVKNLGRVLADLYVAYVGLNKEQQRNLLYQAAGKTQASRVASLLDNYIQAQVLAINAQLNLNSAEAENARIKGTLQARFAGLTAEFERFALLQGSAGPLQVMSGLTTAMRNLLSLMNSNSGSGVVTGFAALFTVLSAKLALTSVQLTEAGAKGNFLTNSFKGIRAAAAGLGDVTRSAIDGFMSSKRGVTGTKTGAQTWSGRVVGALGRGQDSLAGFEAARRKDIAAYQRVLARLPATNNAAGVSARSLAAAHIVLNRTLAATAVGMQRVLLATRATIVAVRSMIFTIGAPMAVLAVGVWAFNAAMEGMGLSSDKATRKLAGFNEEASAAAAAAGAAADAAQLFATVERALPNQRNALERERLLRQVASVAYPEESGAGSQPKTRALEAELQLLLRQNETEKIAQRLRALGDEARLRAGAQRQAEYAANQKALQENRREIERLTTAEANAMFGRDKIRQNLAERTKEQYSLRENSVKLLTESSADLEARLGNDESHSAVLERQKVALQSLNELYRQLPTFSRVDEANRELALLAAQNAELERRRGLIQSDESFARKADAERDARKSGLLQELEAARSEADRLNKPYQELVAALRQQGGGLGANFEPALPAGLVAARNKVSQLEGLIAAVPDTNTLAESSRNDQLKQLEAEQRANRIKEAGLKESLAYAQQADEVARIRERAAGERQQFDYGEDETERLQNQLRGLAQIERQQRAALTGSRSAADTRNAELRILDAVITKQQLLVDLERRRSVLSQQYLQATRDASREFQKNLLTSNSSQLLKQVAAMRLTQNAGPRGLSAGQFLALDPSVRELVQRGFGPGNPGQFNPEVDRIKRELGRLGPKLNDADYVQQFQGPQGEARALYEKFRSFIEPGKTGGFSAETMRALDGATVSATNNLILFSKALAEASGNLGNRSPRVPGDPDPFPAKYRGSGGASGVW